MSTPAPLTELQIQIRLLKWTKETYPKQCRDFHAITNGTNRNFIRRNLDSMSGVVRGIPDLFLPSPVQIYIDKPVFYHGLYLELKKNKRCYPSKAQRAFLKSANNMGYAGTVAKSLEEAKDIVDCYLTAPHRMCKYTDKYS